MLAARLFKSLKHNQKFTNISQHKLVIPYQVKLCTAAKPLEFIELGVCECVLLFMNRDFHLRKMLFTSS